MLDLILVAGLLLVAGVLVWTERVALASESPMEKTLLGGPDPGYFWRLARPAGLSPEAAWPWFLVSKIVLALGLPFALQLLFPASSVLGLLLFSILAFFLPDALLAYVRRQRQANIRRALSFFLDLIVSLLQAGLTLEEAFKRAAREGLPKGHPLAEEASLVADELDLGRDRTTGFQTLGQRTGVRDLRALASALSLGLGSGVSVEATLKAQAELARTKRREEGIRRLNIASAEVLVPLLLCGFPVFVVVVFFPLAIITMRNLQSLGAALR